MELERYSSYTRQQPGTTWGLDLDGDRAAEDDVRAAHRVGLRGSSAWQIGLRPTAEASRLTAVLRKPLLTETTPITEGCSSLRMRSTCWSAELKPMGMIMWALGTSGLTSSSAYCGTTTALMTKPGLRQVFARNSPPASEARRFRFARAKPQAGLIDHQDMIGRFGHQAFGTFAQLERVAPLARHLDGSVDQFVHSVPGVLGQNIGVGAHHDARAAPAYQPGAPHQDLVGVAHGVVVNLQAPSQFPDAGKRLAGLQFLARNQEDDLFRQLLADRDIAFLADVDIHDPERQGC
jgi:hypothetical protein